MESELSKEKFLDLNIIFGIKQELFNTKDPKNKKLSFWKHRKNGNPVFEADFDLSPEQNQIQLYNLC